MNPQFSSGFLCGLSSTVVVSEALWAATVEATRGGVLFAAVPRSAFDFPSTARLGEPSADERRQRERIARLRAEARAIVEEIDRREREDGKRGAGRSLCPGCGRARPPAIAAASATTSRPSAAACQSPRTCTVKTSLAF